MVLWACFKWSRSWSSELCIAWKGGWKDTGWNMVKAWREILTNYKNTQSSLSNSIVTERYGGSWYFRTANEVEFACLSPCLLI